LHKKDQEYEDDITIRKNSTWKTVSLEEKRFCK
jgi:hypothetical protein